MDRALHIEGRQFQYIARISHGKDSLKMLDVIVSRGLPLDRITTTDVWATDTIRGEHPKMVAFKEQADEFIWRKYHIEVEHLCAMRPPALGPATTLLILSDTKTIDLPRAIRALEAAKSRAGKVLWLNPIPQQKWGYIHSVDLMSQICPMVPCSSLNDLARACRRLVQG